MRGVVVEKTPGKTVQDKVVYQIYHTLKGPVVRRRRYNDARNGRSRRSRRQRQNMVRIARRWNGLPDIAKQAWIIASRINGTTPFAEFFKSER